MTYESIQLELVALGNTPSAVADSLFLLGIRGKPYQPCNCPVANYVRGLCGVDKRVVVCNNAVGIEYGELRVQLPRAVSAFYRSFDRGGYPELEPQG